MAASGCRRSSTEPSSLVGARRRANEAYVVQPPHDHDPERAVQRLRPWLALKEPHSPEHPRLTADAIQVVVGERFDFIDVLGFLVHHPNVRVGHVQDLACGPFHDPGKDRTLVLEEKGGKSNGENQTDIFRVVTGEHAERHEVHAMPPIER